MQLEELSTGQRQIHFGHSQSYNNELTKKVKSGPLFITKSEFEIGIEKCRERV